MNDLCAPQSRKILVGHCCVLELTIPRMMGTEAELDWATEGGESGCKAIELIVVEISEGVAEGLRVRD